MMMIIPLVDLKHTHTHLVVVVSFTSSVVINAKSQWGKKMFIKIYQKILIIIYDHQNKQTEKKHFSSLFFFLSQQVNYNATGTGWLDHFISEEEEKNCEKIFSQKKIKHQMLSLLLKFFLFLISTTKWNFYHYILVIYDDLPYIHWWKTITNPII